MPDDVLRVFGIDLGTTYSVISYVDETGRPTVCRNKDGLETTPSVVYFENASNIVVGSVAKSSALLEPDRVVSLIKREMGTEAQFEFDGTTYTPESISALILKQLSQDAAAHTDGEVRRVVITVPAYFGMLERDATRNAGRIAGLDVVGVVPEPVAAALHYDATTGAERKTLLVYDLGGGTFDTSVIRVTNDEIVVLCTDGDDHLGGADWDARLGEFLLERFKEQTPPGVDPEEDQEFMQALATTAEETKKQLSRTQSRPVALRGAGVSARVDISRDQFEELTGDLLDKTVEIVKRTLETLRTKEPDATIDEVLLVGGSTRMPAVTERLAKEFGWQPKLHDPDLAVAKGAALYAIGRVVHKEQQDARDQAGTPADAEKLAGEAIEAIAAQTGIATEKLADFAKDTFTVLPKAFGVKLIDTSRPDWRTSDHYYVKHLVHANDRLPAYAELTPGTVEDGQRAVEIELYEQSGVVAGEQMSENKALNEGSGTIDGLPPMPAGSPINITMSVDNEGLLELTAVEPTSGKKLNIKVRVGVLTDEQVEAATKAVSALTVSG